MTIHIEIIEGSGGEKTRDGWVNMTRIATVSGVSGSGQAQLVNAVTTLEADSRVGPPSSVHPDVSELQLARLRPRALGGGVVEVTLIYEQADTSEQPGAGGTQIEVGERLRQVETNKDATGKTVEVEFTYPTDPADPDYPSGNPTLAGQTVKKSPLFMRDAAERTLVITRMEAGSPGAKAAMYVNALNSGGFRLDPGAAPETWRVAGIMGRGPEGGPYTVTYELQFNYNGWNSDEAVYIDDTKQAPPVGLVQGKGIVPIKKYTTIDFSGLNL